MKEAIFRIIDKLDLRMISLTAWLISGTGVFLPNKYIELMGLMSIKVKYQWVISSVFLVLSAYYIIVILHFVYYKIKIIYLEKINRKVILNKLRTLSTDEQRILLQFYNKNEKIFGLEARLGIQNATVNVLSSKRIISRGSQIGGLYRGFSYFLQPMVQVELNKMLTNGEIKVYDQKFEWKVESD